MEKIHADTHLMGKSLFEKFYQHNTSAKPLVYPAGMYIMPGYHELNMVDYDEGVKRLLDLAGNVFMCQPTRLFLHGLFQIGKQREFWLFNRSGVYRAGLFDYENDLEVLCTEYRNMTKVQLGINPLINQKFGGPQYIYIKDQGSEMATYGSDHKREYKLVLDEKPLIVPRDIVSWVPTCYRATDQFNNQFVVKFSPRKEQSEAEEKFLCLAKEHNVWGITELIDYQHIDTSTTSLSCMVITPFGRPITEYSTVLEVLECMRDTIKAHRSLYLDARILHRDISVGNILISNAGNNEPGDSKWILIDLDCARDMEFEPEKPYSLTGTKTFVAIDLSRGSDDRVLHTYRHDLESFFYVFLFMAISRHGRVSHESRLRPWQVGWMNWPEIAEKKDISNNGNFAAIPAEFRPEFKGLESLAHLLRNTLFFPDGYNFFTGTRIDIRETEKLYSGMIDAFEQLSRIENKTGALIKKH